MAVPPRNIRSLTARCRPCPQFCFRCHADGTDGCHADDTGLYRSATYGSLIACLSSLSILIGNPYPTPQVTVTTIGSRHSASWEGASTHRRPASSRPLDGTAAKLISGSMDVSLRWSG